MSSDFYRDELANAYVRIEKLEDELDRYRSDPAHELVNVAEERLVDARSRRERFRKWAPRVLIVGFVLMSAFALTPLGEVLAILGYIVCAVGLLALFGSFAVLAILGAQGQRPNKIVELERRVRVAKGEVGLRVQLRAPPADAAFDVTYLGEGAAEARRLG